MKLGSKPKITEDHIRRQVTDYLSIKGWGWYPNIAGKLYFGDGPNNYPGIADLTAIKNGRVVWIELKSPTGVQSDNQKEFEAFIKSHGGEYVLARSIEDLQEAKI